LVKKQNRSGIILLISTIRTLGTAPAVAVASAAAFGSLGSVCSASPSHRSNSSNGPSLPISSHVFTWRVYRQKPTLTRKSSSKFHLLKALSDRILSKHIRALLYLERRECNQSLGTTRLKKHISVTARHFILMDA